MLSLPAIHGRFPVGATTFVVPVRPAQPIGKAKLKSPHLSQPDSNHALQLEEVAFTAYYPADTSQNPSKGIDWLFRPLSYSLLGLSTYIGVSTWLLWPAVYFFGSLLKVPAYSNAPLLHPKNADAVSETQWPLVIFSHGLGGSRTTYSQYCSGLAASGKVVLALEHRDGTGMACVPRSWEVDVKKARRSMVYLRESDVYWKEGEEPRTHPKPLRGEQLEFRHHEIHIMYEAFTKFLKKELDQELCTMDQSPLDKASWSSPTSDGSSVIRYNKDVYLTGHSFGGATTLSLLSTKPSENYSRIPISKAIVLDPWLDPLPTPGLIPPIATESAQRGVVIAEPAVESPLNGPTPSKDSDSTLASLPSERARLFVINSEVFTLWKDHYARLEDLMSAWEPQGRRIATIIGSQHISFSDFSLLPLFRKRKDTAIFSNIMRLSLAFLEDKLDESLKTEIPTTEMSIEIVGTKPDGKPKRKLAGPVSHVIIS